MHTNLALGAWSLIPLLCTVVGQPVPGPLFSPSTNANDIQPRRAPNQPLTLVSPSASGSFLTRPKNQHDASPTNQSSASVESSQGFIPYPVPKSPVTLFFHTFGSPVPTTYILDSIAVSLARVLAMTARGRGKDLIRDGFFCHTHECLNNDTVTITLVDFRESGKPMDYNGVRDTLIGMRNFMKEPGREPTPLSFEIEVSGRYVGTGHLDYDLANGSDVGVV